MDKDEYKYNKPLYEFYGDILGSDLDLYCLPPGKVILICVIVSLFFLICLICVIWRCKRRSAEVSESI